MKQYTFVRGGTYAEALRELQKVASPNHPQDKGIYRPLTLRESMQARNEQEDLFEHYADTYSAMLYDVKGNILPLTGLENHMGSGDDNWPFAFFREAAHRDTFTNEELWLSTMGGRSGNIRYIFMGNG